MVPASIAFSIEVLLAWTTALCAALISEAFLVSCSGVSLGVSVMTASHQSSTATQLHTHSAAIGLMRRSSLVEVGCLAGCVGRELLGLCRRIGDRLHFDLATWDCLCLPLDTTPSERLPINHTPQRVTRQTNAGIK